MPASKTRPSNCPSLSHEPTEHVWIKTRSSRSHVDPVTCQDLDTTHKRPTQLLEVRIWSTQSFHACPSMSALHPGTIKNNKYFQISK